MRSPCSFIDMPPQTLLFYSSIASMTSEVWNLFPFCFFYRYVNHLTGNG